MKNLHIKLFFYTLSLAMIGCTKVDDQAVSLAKVEVAKLLKDPESAKFTEVFTVDLTPRKDGEFSMGVCGMVNGKNAFGAYGGAIRFASKILVRQDKSTVLIIADIDNESNSEKSIFDDLYWNRFCRHNTTLSRNG